MNKPEISTTIEFKHIASNQKKLVFWAPAPWARASPKWLPKRVLKLYFMTSLHEFIDKGFGRIRSFLQGSRQRGKITADEEKQILERLQGTTKLETFEETSLIIEAVPEKLELKRDIFKQLDCVCAPETLLATNTSSFSVTAIAANTQHPERVLGLHFFNPPPLMALVEVIQGDRTAAELIDKATDLMRRMGKTPARAKDTPGFIVNRVARPFYNEALRILGDGDATVETIDRIMRLAGNFRMGPFELMDLIGHDVNFAATESLYRSFFEDPRFRPKPHSASDGHGRKSRKENGPRLLRL